MMTSESHETMSLLLTMTTVKAQTFEWNKLTCHLLQSVGGMMADRLADVEDRSLDNDDHGEDADLREEQVDVPPSPIGRRNDGRQTG
jgi:hypothetical protein